MSKHYIDFTIIFGLLAGETFSGNILVADQHNQSHHHSVLVGQPFEYVMTLLSPLNNVHKASSDT